MNFFLFEEKWRFLLVILAMQILVLTVVLFDVQIMRQVVGFIFYTFFPGFIIIKLMGLKHLGRLEIVLFSLGSSIAFLMLSGLFVNELLLALGVSQALSLIPLLVAQTGFIIAGAAAVSLRGDGSEFLDTRSISPRFNKSLTVLVFLPILSIIGAMSSDVLKSNIMPLSAVVLISVLFSVILFEEKRLPQYIYPLAVFVIAVSLLLGSSLISKNIVSFGSDVYGEYYIQRITQNGGHWSSTFFVAGDIGYGRLNAMLSITILPTVYSVLLNMDSGLVFKVLFSAIFAFVPLCLYLFWESEVGAKGAFVAAFLFMAQMTFFSEMLGLQRQMIGEVFFALLLILISSKKLGGWVRSACFGFLSAGLVVSHYALAEVFLFFFVTVYVCMMVVKRQSRKMTLSMIILFFVIMFSWYLYTSNAAVFDSFVSFGNNVYSQLNQFLNPESRGQTVLRGLGLEAAPTIWNSIGRAFAYFTELLIAIGFVALVIKKNSGHFEKEQYALSLVAVSLLAALIMVPGLANTLGIARFYHILLFLLASLLVVGVEFISKLPFKRKQVPKLFASALLVCVLVPYFLFQSGLVYELMGSESYSLPLSKNRMNQWFSSWNLGYFKKTEVSGTLWLSKNINVQGSTVYTDSVSRGILVAYGMIYTSYMETFTNNTSFSPNSVVYLNRANTLEEVAIRPGIMWNITSISPKLDLGNMIYSNGECEIYGNP